MMLPPLPIRPGIPQRPVVKAGIPKRPQVSTLTPLPIKSLANQHKMERIQINRLFDEAKEMEAYVKLSHPGARIVKTWTKTQFACEIEFESVKSLNKK